MNGRLPVRARILLVFRDEFTILSRRDVLEAARTNDYNELRHLVDAGLVRRDGNEYGITPVGRERRNKYHDTRELTHG